MRLWSRLNSPETKNPEVVALSLAAEAESIDSENRLFRYKLQEYKDKIPDLISRRQSNNRRKYQKHMARKPTGDEDFFFVDSKQIEVCWIARGKR